MGVITSRISLPFFRAKNPEVYIKQLEDINKEVLELDQSRLRLGHQYSFAVDFITTYTRLLYIFVALIFFFSTLPSSFLEYVLFCGPLLIFHLLISTLKIAMKWYYDYELSSNVDKIQKLKFKKRQLLCKVKETTQFKEAMEIIDKYGPDKKLPRPMPKLPTNPSSPYLDNVVSYVLGEKKKNSLICFHCNWHNGMAPEDECDYIAFRCCHCLLMNHPRKRLDVKKEL